MGRAAERVTTESRVKGMEKIKRQLVAVSVAAFLFAIPAAAFAAESRVYIRFSIGGSLVIGGGILIWSFGTASRVSRTDPGSADRPAFSFSPPAGRFARTEKAKPASPIPETGCSSDLLIEVPFMIFHW
jgi:hypothetical protein